MSLFLMILGLVFYLVGALSLMVEEFKTSILWGLVCLFLQPGHLIFCIIHFDKCKGHLGMILAGVLCFFAAVYMGGSCC